MLTTDDEEPLFVEDDQVVSETIRLTRDDVGLFLAEAVQLMGTLEAADVHQRPAWQSLPSGLFTCGEACRMVPAVIAMALQMYPDLIEEGVLEQIIRNAEIAGAGGAAN